MYCIDIIQHQLIGRYSFLSH